MGLKKIENPWEDIKKICASNEHEPPKFRVYEPGTYEYTCPNCGNKMTFTVAPVIF